ncbi:methyltransferase domain-containing protein [Cohnella xylanilytica]|uniref:Methyltransferase domain-containing protein n=1 Tax=Cohnella xylanilytica TaxID=557555 RepID=A0A841TXP7_9BACL|nr:methyltransferase domain-containing protein [Cohnella xylanilytica]
MGNRLRTRAREPELMDDFARGGEELREALRHLRLLNRVFGASGPALYGVKRLWKEAGRPGDWTVLDVGAGSGDVNRALLRWADREGVRLGLVLMDKTEEACEEARSLFRGESRIEVRRGDLFELPPRCADVVTASQLAHHFSDEELPSVLTRLLEASRIGAVLADIHRHWLAWLAVSLATRVLSRNRYIRHDGPLSVAKGFRREDWARLGAGTGGTVALDVSWRPLFRYAAVARLCGQGGCGGDLGGGR